MKKLLLLCVSVVLLFAYASCGGAEGSTGVSFEIGGESHVWTKGEVGVFGEDAIVVQSEEDGVYRLSMIASKETLKSGTNSSDNVISFGMRSNASSWRGKSQGLIILWLEGTRHTGLVDIEIARFGKVGETVSGKFSGKAGELDVKGMFNLRRIEDKSLEGDE
jgi:hypothetical protein